MTPDVVPTGKHETPAITTQAREQAYAFARMCEARRTFLNSWAEWLATAPDRADAAVELGGTTAAVNQLVRFHAGEGRQNG